MQVKLWDISSGAPQLVAAQDLKAGAVFAAAFCPASPFLIAAGGAKGSVAVWDTLTDARVAAKYGKLAGRTQRAAQQAEAIAPAGS